MHIKLNFYFYFYFQKKKKHHLKIERPEPLIKKRGRNRGLKKKSLSGLLAVAAGMKKGCLQETVASFISSETTDCQDHIYQFSYLVKIAI